MLYQIIDGTLSFGENPIFSHLNFELKGKEKVSLVGRNGAGKTTLLRLLAGELSLDRDDRRNGPGIRMSRKLTIGMLRQQAFDHMERTVEEEILKRIPTADLYDRERFDYEKEYDRLFTGLGFAKDDKKRCLGEFSGGQQTRIALLCLLLERPDILLLDEPTNHLDMEASQWLEGYLCQYDGAVVVVSHDRFFLDQVAEVVWELEGGKAVCYPGNYTCYRQEKRKRMELRKKAWERQQQEIHRLEQVIERFKHKPTKASFARAKKKQLERMEKVEPATRDEAHLFTGELTPLILGSKLVYEAEHLKLGYDKTLLELSLRIRRGQKIGLLGPNGGGKSTFLKTVVGLIPALSGKGKLGNQITIGYFDQHSARIQSEKSVREHFLEHFPGWTDKEVRSVLGAYLFRGREAERRVSDLSGGEKARLVLAELLESRPNFLVLDEPTNHMDIPAKETLESAFRTYTGTILFVSHDRYFIRQVAEAVLIFEDGQAFYYPFGYAHYLERMTRESGSQGLTARIQAEDQALVDSFRAVPKVKQHRFREISTEEAYEDWRLRLVREKMEKAGERLEELLRQRESLFERWMEAGECGNGDQGAEAGEYQRRDGLGEEYEEMKVRVEEAWKQWHEACMEWWDVWGM
ncbi:MAG: ABC-F family ATP-binding cassette domain-containing protein [Lachnospiraceae bacterium]|jgi:ATP-binding cassette subfamily F protein 3|nr:ABC-F family ATP-binding cassette domain-containing protein [Lachnospiraceae bacterium]